MRIPGDRFKVVGYSEDSPMGDYYQDDSWAAPIDVYGWRQYGAAGTPACTAVRNIELGMELSGDDSLDKVYVTIGSGDRVDLSSYRYGNEYKAKVAVKDAFHKATVPLSMINKLVVRTEYNVKGTPMTKFNSRFPPLFPEGPGCATSG